MDIYLREAHKRDISDFYRYLNREHVKKYSKKEKEEWFRHKKWYREIIESSRSKIYVINDMKLNFYGLIRYDFQENYAVVSIFIPLHMRGKGYGKVALEKSLKLIGREGVEEVRAEILEENDASIGLFERTGFVCRGSRDEDSLLFSKSLKS